MELAVLQCARLEIAHLGRAVLSLSPIPSLSLNPNPSALQQAQLMQVSQDS